MPTEPERSPHRVRLYIPGFLAVAGIAVAYVAVTPDVRRAFEVTLLMLAGVWTLACGLVRSGSKPVLPTAGLASAGALLLACSVERGTSGPWTDSAAAGAAALLAFTVVALFLRGDREVRQITLLVLALLIVILVADLRDVGRDTVETATGSSDDTASTTTTEAPSATTSSTTTMAPPDAHEAPTERDQSRVVDRPTGEKAAPDASAVPDQSSDEGETPLPNSGCDLTNLGDLPPSVVAAAHITLIQAGRGPHNCPAGPAELRGRTWWVEQPSGDHLVLTGVQISAVSLMQPSLDGAKPRVDEPASASTLAAKVIDNVSSAQAADLLGRGAAFPLDRGLCGTSGDVIILVSTESPGHSAGVLLRRWGADRRYLFIGPAMLRPWMDSLIGKNAAFPVDDAEGEWQEFTVDYGETVRVRANPATSVAVSEVAAVCNRR